MINILYILLILLVNSISIIFLGLRYRYVLGYLGDKIRFTSSFFIVCLSSTINYLIPFKGGVFVGGPTAAKLKENIGVEKSSVVLIFEQLFEAIWQIIFILIAISVTGNKLLKNNILFNVIFLILILTIVIYFIIKHDKLLSILIKLYAFFPNKLKKLIERIGIKKDNTNEAFKNLKLLFTKKIFLLNYSFRTLIIIFATPLNLFLILMAFSYSVSYFNILLIFWVSFILGKLSGLPGGIGLRDLTIGTFLVKFGVPTALTVKIVFLHRILSLFPAIPVGSILILYFSKGKLYSFYKRLFSS